MPEGQQDHGRIAMPVPITAGSLHQPLDLFLGEVLSGSIMLIWAATTPNCSLYSAWRSFAGCGFHWRNSTKLPRTDTITHIMRTVCKLFELLVSNTPPLTEEGRSVNRGSWQDQDRPRTGRSLRARLRVRHLWEEGHGMV